MPVFSKHCNNGAGGNLSENKKSTNANQRNFTMTDNKSRAKESTTVKSSAAAENNAAKKEGKISATDSGKGTPASSDKKKSRKARRKPRAGSYLILLMFILLLALLAALAYWVEKQQKELANHSRDQIEQLRNEVNPELEQLKTTSRELQQRLTRQEKKQRAVNDAFKSLLKTRRHLRNDWLLAETDYLLRLAGQRLLLARDTGTAVAAIETADARLRETGDPALIPLRTMLASDISRLKAVPEPDITGLSARLSALTHAVDSLPLLSAYTDSHESKAPGAGESSRTKEKDWKQLPAAIWGDIKKLLIIRERHGRVIPLLSPKQHFFLIQNLKLKLEQARLALLNTEPEIYRERLQSAIAWIHEFFKQDDPATQAMLVQLKQLVAKNIKPALPDISASYRALQHFRDQQGDNAKHREGPA